MDNVQKHNNFINVAKSQPFRSQWLSRFIRRYAKSAAEIALGAGWCVKFKLLTIGTVTQLKVTAYPVNDLEVTVSQN
jgi:hypothetical protein